MNGVNSFSNEVSSYSLIISFLNERKTIWFKVFNTNINRIVKITKTTNILISHSQDVLQDKVLLINHQITIKITSAAILENYRRITNILSDSSKVTMYQWNRSNLIKHLSFSSKDTGLNESNATSKVDDFSVTLEVGIYATAYKCILVH